MFNSKLYVTILIAGSVVASEAPHNALLEPEEIIIDEAGGERAGTNSFLMRDAARQVRLLNANSMSRTRVSASARKAFRRLKFHGRSKARPSVRRYQQRDSEFFFDEIEGRKVGVNAFLIQHAR